MHAASHGEKRDYAAQNGRRSDGRSIKEVNRIFDSRLIVDEREEETPYSSIKKQSAWPWLCPITKVPTGRKKKQKKKEKKKEEGILRYPEKQRMNFYQEHLQHSVQQPPIDGMNWMLQRRNICLPCLLHSSRMFMLSNAERKTKKKNAALSLSLRKSVVDLYDSYPRCPYMMMMTMMMMMSGLDC